MISMIFGHAPLVFPAVMGRHMAYHPVLYGHVVLLHASLVMRVAGDLGGWLPFRQWGGLLNAAAIVWFLVATAVSSLIVRRKLDRLDLVEVLKTKE